MTVLVQAGMQANEFARAIYRAGISTNLTKIGTGKKFFFSQDLKETCP